MRKTIFTCLLVAILAFQFCAPAVKVIPEIHTINPGPDSPLWKYLRAGNPEKVLNSTEGKRDVSSLVLRGFAFLQLENFQLAEESFLQALVQEENVFAFIGLGIIYEKKGELVKAYKNYKKAQSHPFALAKMKELAPKAAQQLLSLAGENLDLLLEALAIDPENKEIYLRIAQVYENKGELFLARAYLKRALEKFPDDFDLVDSYVRVLEKEGNLEEALKTWESIEGKINEELYRRRMEELKAKIRRLKIEEKIKPIRSKVYITRADMAVLLDAYFGDFFEIEDRPPIITDLYDKWSRHSIIKITGAGLMEVFPDHTFMPDERVTRGKFAQILYRLLNKLGLLQKIRVGWVEIKDISHRSRYYKAASLLVGLGIMDVKDGYFRPHEGVYTEEAIKAMEKLMELIVSSGN